MKKIIGLYDAEKVADKVMKTRLMYAEDVGVERGMKKVLEKGLEKGTKIS